MKRPSSLTLLNLALFLVLGVGILHDSRAQSWGDFLKHAAGDAARQAVGNNVRQTVTNAVDGAAKGLVQPPAQPAAAARPHAAPGCPRRKGTPLSIGERPESFEPASLWPEDTGCPVYAVADLRFDEARAAKTAFREASKVPCGDCEGGYAFDAWGGRSLVKSGDYAKEFPKLLVALEQGQSLGWKGNRYDVRITATGAHPVGDMPCRQFHYTLLEKGRLVAQYDGMFCEYTRPYSAAPSWNEMV